MGEQTTESGGTIQPGKAGVSDAETLAAEPGQSVIEPADRVKYPGTYAPVNGATWDYAAHPGGCCARVVDGAHTVCCAECAGTGMFPVPWVEDVNQACTSGDAGCVACKETGRAMVALAAPTTPPADSKEVSDG